MIRGKKNFLPPHPLIMGFGLLFRLDESSLGSHLNERRVRGEEEAIDDYEETGPPEEKSDSENDATDDKSVAKKNGNAEAEDSANSFQNNVATINPETTLSSDFPREEKGTLNMADRENSSEIRGHGIASVNRQLEELLDRALELGSAAKSGKGYGVESAQVDLGGEHHIEERKAAVRDKPYISKTERRKHKKEHKQGSADSNVEHGKGESKLTDISARQPAKEAQNSKTGGQKLSRGQRSKLKKIKEKYADQDEEERSIRMALLAVCSSNLHFALLIFNPEKIRYISHAI